MEKKYYPITGVKGVSVAKNVVDSAEGYSAGVPSALLFAQNVNWATEQPAEDLFGNDRRLDRFYGSKKETITFQLTGLSAEEDAEFRGIYMKPSSGRSYGTGDEEPPYTALGIKIKKGKDDYVYLWFLKGLITGGDIVAETKKDGVTLNTREYTYESLVTDKTWEINGEQKGVSYVKGDTTTSAFNPDGWFSQVQTPDTESAPDALALSSSDPVDDATDVAVDKEPKLTFNNAIESEAIQIIDTTEGTIVPVTKTWSADRKQITLSHVADFDLSETYRIVLAGVRDAYGQTLAATTIDFSTVDA